MKEKLTKVENDFRLFEARMGGVWEGMGMAERAPTSPSRSVRSMQSHSSWSGQQSNRGGNTSGGSFALGLSGAKAEPNVSIGAVTFPPRSTTGSVAATSSLGVGADRDSEEEEELKVASLSKAGSSKNEINIFTKLNDITALTNEILSDGEQE